MKQTLLNIMLIIALLGVGFLAGQSSSEPEIKTVTKVKTVTTGYDSSYVSILQIMLKKSRAEAKAERERNKKLAWKLRNVKPTVVVDTFTVHDTLFTVYSSAFRIGTDTLNCSGNAHFDMKKFYFTDTNFNYPRRTIFRTKIITQTNWTITAIGVALGVIAGVAIR